MILKNGLVLNHLFQFCKLDLMIHEGKIDRIDASLDTTSKETLDLSGCMIIPGLIDIHIHGFNGYDTMDATNQSLEGMSISLAQKGTTSFLPTTTTMPIQKIHASFDNIKACMGKTSGANILGINMEGPFLNKNCAGAQDVESIILPDIAYIKDYMEHIKLLTIAPEMDGALDFIQKVSNQICISIGHTEADYETAEKAIAFGARNATHLFNCMPPLHHRAIGAAGAILDKNLYAELICDGEHISPPMIRLAVTLLGFDRAILISDAMRAANKVDGEYELGGQKITVQNGRAFTKQGRFAGSTSCLLDCVKNAVKFGIPINQAVKMATINPASLIKVADRKGSIKEGMDADLLVIDDQWNIKYVIINGKPFDIKSQ